MPFNTHNAQKTQGDSISKLGLVLSRFEFNKAPNPCYKPGEWFFWGVGLFATWLVEQGPCAVAMNSLAKATYLRS